MDSKPLNSEFFEAIFAAGPHPYLILRADEAFTIAAVNDRYLAVTGTERGQIIGRGLFEVFPDNPSDHSGSGVSDLRSSLNRVLSQRAPDTMGVQKYDIPLHDGSNDFEIKYWSPINTPVIDADGRISCIIHHVEDVTEYIFSQERASKEFEEKRGKIEDRAQRMEAEVLLRARELKDANRSLKIAMEEIERREQARRVAEEALRERDREITFKNRQLEQASQMKSEFLANMSHELRTPLNAIIGFSEVLKDGLAGDMNEKQQRYVSNIFGSGQHLLSLINDILDLSKVEAGKMTLDLELLDLQQLLYNSLSIIREKASSHRISLQDHTDSTMGEVLLDARKTKQILYNLLSNAIKFTADGGEVLLRTRAVTREDVGHPSSRHWPGLNFALADSGYARFIEIEVIDSGIGIPEEFLSRLFKPFSQIDSSLARQFEGTGLGLALVRQLAELHGGTVGIESAVGKGSSFRVWLPLQTAEHMLQEPFRKEMQEMLEIQEPVQHLSGSSTALVVEDEDQAAELIRLQLETEGIKVLRAASAEEGLQILHSSTTINLIILDLLFPGMDGWEFLQRIKKNQQFAHIPVVITSIVANNAKGMSFGAAAVMQKPVSRSLLQNALADLGVGAAADRILNVLVADDDPEAVDILTEHLTGPKYHVLQAYGGRETIELARRKLPDIIVLDLIMPGVSGFDVLKALEEHPATASIPVLVVTARQISGVDRELLQGKVVKIISKADLDQGRFLREVRRALASQ